MSEDQPRNRALETVEQIRDALEDNNLQDALTQIDTLQAQLAEWKRSDARKWLNDALQGDLLLFNTEAANQRLDQWASTNTDDDPELTQYRERVTARAKQKQVEFQARGVVAHCRELWRQGDELERSTSPPHPDFLLANYYTKARDVASAAYAENKDSPSLDTLLQQAESLRRNKLTANRIYKLAMEDDQYAEALDSLIQLDSVELIPRYWIVSGQEDSELTTFDKMVPREEARQEIERLARAWAADRAETIIAQAEDHLSKYRPQPALDALMERKRIERFLGDTPIQKLYRLESQANEAQRLYEQAERRARQAIRLAEENPMNAWNIYAEAYHTYRGAPSLAEARRVSLDGLAMELERLIAQAEDDYDNRRMERIGDAFRGAQADYGEKDPVLDELLARFEEVAQEAQAFLEYLNRARDLMRQIREQSETDIVAAGELLAELDDFPPVILDQLDDLPDLRNSVRQRLNIELVYNQLYKLMFSDDLAEVERGIEAAGEYETEPRMRSLSNSLGMHRMYLVARQQYDSGEAQKALILLEQIAVRQEHPDSEAAGELVEQIRAEMADEADTE